MAKYKSVQITEAGLAIISAAQTGDTIYFTSVKSGNGTYTGSEDLKTMTGLKSVKQTFGITGITRTDDNVVRVRTVLNNEGLTEAYSLNEIGLFAKDPETENEVLYAIIVAETPDLFPVYSEAPTSVTLEIYLSATSISEGVEFTAQIIEGTYLTVQDFEDYKLEVKETESEILGAVKTNSDNIGGNEYDSTASYKNGDLCLKDGLIYQCNTDINKESWTEAHWKQTSLSEVSNALNQNITQVNTNLSFPDGVGFYPDIQDGKRGYNTDAARGADTFVPFSTIFSEFDLSYISTSATKRVINVSEGNVVMYYTNATAFSTSGVIVDNLSIGNYCVLVCKGSGTLTIIPNAQTTGWIGGILR